MFGFIGELSQGNGKVISKSHQGQISSKRWKIEYWHSTSNNSVGTQPKYMVTSVGVWFHRGVIPRHGKVISRWQKGQISWKRLKINHFCCFCWHDIPLKCIWWFETYIYPNTDLHQNTQRGYRDNIRVGGTFHPPPPPPTQITLMSTLFDMAEIDQI